MLRWSRLLKTLERDASKGYSDPSNIFSTTVLILARFRIHKHILLCVLLLFADFRKKQRVSFCFGATSLPFLVPSPSAAAKQKSVLQRTMPIFFLNNP